MFISIFIILVANLSLLDKYKQRVCDLLVHIGALKFGVFTLTSGKLSSYYIDMRLIPSFPEVFKEVVDIYSALIKELIGVQNFERIAGVPTAGVPFSSVLAYKLNKPFLYIRKDVKLHGRRRRVEGIINPSDRVLLVDDLVTTGKTLVEATAAIRNEGGVVEKAVVLIDRQEGAWRRLKEIGVELHSLLKIEEAANLLYREGVIDKSQYTSIIKQIEE